MQLEEGKFYKLERSALVGYYFTDPFGALPYRFCLPAKIILHLEEVKYFRRPCGNGHYARFTLFWENKEISLYVRASRNKKIVAGLLSAHPLEAIADAAGD